MKDRFQTKRLNTVKLTNSANKFPQKIVLENDKMCL